MPHGGRIQGTGKEGDAGSQTSGSGSDLARGRGMGSGGGRGGLSIGSMGTAVQSHEDGRGSGNTARGQRGRGRGGGPVRAIPIPEASVGESQEEDEDEEEDEVGIEDEDEDEGQWASGDIRCEDVDIDNDHDGHDDEDAEADRAHSHHALNNKQGHDDHQGHQLSYKGTLDGPDPDSDWILAPDPATSVGASVGIRGHNHHGQSPRAVRAESQRQGTTQLAGGARGTMGAMDPELNVGRPSSARGRRERAAVAALRKQAAVATGILALPGSTGSTAGHDAFPFAERGEGQSTKKHFESPHSSLPSREIAMGVGSSSGSGQRLEGGILGSRSRPGTGTGTRRRAEAETETGMDVEAGLNEYRPRTSGAAAAAAAMQRRVGTGSGSGRYGPVKDSEPKLRYSEQWMQIPSDDSESESVRGTARPMAAGGGKRGRGGAGDGGGGLGDT